MAKSIIQAHTDKLSRECILCREEAEKMGYYGELPHTGLHKHHIMFGVANRKKSEHYGLWAYVCNERHHEHGPEAPHMNKEVNIRLRKIAQEIFEKRYSHELWMQEFGKNYLEEQPAAVPDQKEKEPGFVFIGNQLEGE